MRQAQRERRKGRKAETEKGVKRKGKRDRHSESCGEKKYINRKEERENEKWTEKEREVERKRERNQEICVQKKKERWNLKEVW